MVILKPQKVRLVVGKIRKILHLSDSTEEKQMLIEIELTNGLYLNYQICLKHFLPRTFIMPTKLTYSTQATLDHSLCYKCETHMKIKTKAEKCTDQLRLYFMQNGNKSAPTT